MLSFALILMQLISALCVVIFWEGLSVVDAENVISCGGFVKSDHAIDFSKIMVKLLTKEGNLKYETDCAPINGYYMIPVYSLGEYSIKIVPPEGWDADPVSVKITINGESDACSKGEDINFHFKGFTVQGKVESKGLSDGPEGLMITLNNDKGGVVHETKTAERGSYTFRGVAPGSYAIAAASNADVCLSSAAGRFTVTDDRVAVKDPIVVTGYRLQGHIVNQGAAVAGVDFILMAEKAPATAAAGEQKLQLTAEQLAVVPEAFRKWSPAARQASDKAGQFAFDCVPPGKYVIVPFFKQHGVVFDVFPSFLQQDISHSSIFVETKFEVRGFTVAGRVELAEGVPLTSSKPVEVLLDGKVQAKADSSGKFLLQHVASGTYTIGVKAEGYRFQDLKIEISPNNPRVPPLRPAEHEQCGQVLISQWPTGLTARMTQRKLLVTGVKGQGQGQKDAGSGTGTFSLTTDNDGKWCTWLKAGTYSIEVCFVV